MSFNINSLIIYLGIIAIISADMVNGELGYSLGLAFGLFFIYFLLANDEDRKRIRNNLLWRVPKQ